MPGANHNGAIGADTWPGLLKLIEECGEVQQRAAKILAFPFAEVHPDGTNLKECLEDELADLSAAIQYVIGKNKLSTARIGDRRVQKWARFERWDREERERRQKIDERIEWYGPGS